MKNLILKALSFFFVLVFLQACSEGGDLVANKRDVNFYDQFVNSTNDWPQAENRVGELKLLQIDKYYQMRYALFDNGRVYYQIDGLGNGDGFWKFEEGALIVTAQRPIFDMELTFSGEKTEGDNMVVRFFDRHGFNTAPVNFRSPATIKAQERVPPLKQFKASLKNI